MTETKGFWDIACALSKKAQCSIAAGKACWASTLSGARARAGVVRGQGTTEYAILVGVLVVIAILAITVFRPKIQELWDAIANGINNL